MARLLGVHAVVRAVVDAAKGEGGTELAAFGGSAFRVAVEARQVGTLKPPSLAGSPNVLEQELEQILTQAATDYGLSPPEIDRLLLNSRALIDGASNVPASQVAHHFSSPTCSFCQASQRSARRLDACRHEASTMKAVPARSSQEA